MSLLCDDVIQVIFSYINGAYNIYLDYRYFIKIRSWLSLDFEAYTYTDYIWQSIKHKRNFYVMRNYPWHKFPKYYLSKYCYYIEEMEEYMNDFKYRNISYPMHLVTKKSNFNLLIKNPSFDKSLILKWIQNVPGSYLQYSKHFDYEIFSKFLNAKRPMVFSTLANVKDDVRNDPEFKKRYSPETKKKKEKVDLDRPNFKSISLYKKIKWDINIVDVLSKVPEFDWSIMSSYLPIISHNLKKYPKFKPDQNNKFYREGDDVLNKFSSRYL